MNLQETIYNEIKHTTTLLDLCAGPGHWTQGINAVKTAVELNPKYTSMLQNNGYSNIRIEDVRNINYTDSVFDVILWIDGIEHLTEKDALKTLEEAEKHCKKILVFTPNEFISNQDSVDHLNEPLQAHLSVFPTSFWEQRGYEVIYREYNSKAKVNNLLYKKVFK